MSSLNLTIRIYNENNLIKVIILIIIMIIIEETEMFVFFSNFWWQIKSLWFIHIAGQHDSVSSQLFFFLFLHLVVKNTGKCFYRIIAGDMDTWAGSVRLRKKTSVWSLVKICHLLQQEMMSSSTYHFLIWSNVILGLTGNLQLIFSSPH